MPESLTLRSVRVARALCLSGIFGAQFAVAQPLHWTQTSAGTSNLYGVTWSETHKQYVTVGSGGKIFTSVDGITWTSRSSGTATSLQAVAWGAGSYVAVGESGVILVSSDGVNWNARSSGSTRTLLGVTWIQPESGAKGYWIVGGTASTILTSSDAVAWIKRTDGLEGNTLGFHRLVWADPFHDSIGLVVAVGEGGIIYTSPNGITWTKRTSNSPTAYLNTVAWTGSQIVAVGQGYVVRSSNASAWTSTRVPMAADLFGLAYAPGRIGRLVATGSGANAKCLFFSQDEGSTWTTLDSIPGTRYAAVWGGHRFVVVGQTNPNVLVSDDESNLVIDPPAAPVLNLPAVFATSVPNPAVLTWSAASGAIFYHLQLSLVPDFATTVLNDSNRTGLADTSAPLTAGTYYYWRVRAKNLGGTSDWSTIRRFTPAAAAVISVSGTLASSQDFVLSGNTLGFRIATPDRVRVRIADLHGKVLEEVVDARFDAGTYELALPAAKHGDLRLLIFRSGAFSRTVPLLP